MKGRDIITFTPSLRPSTSHLQWQGTDQKTQREWRTATCPERKGRKKDKNTFSFVSRLLQAHPAWQARFQSRSYEKCQECFHLRSFLFLSSPLHLFWSYLPLWVVVIGRAVYLLSAGLEAVAFEMLSLCSRRRRQTWNQQTWGGKKNYLKERHIWLMFEPNVGTTKESMVYHHQTLKSAAELDAIYAR